MSLTLLTDHFADIEDPRQASKVTYKLFDVLFLMLTAVISGAEGWEEIEDFGHLRPATANSGSSPLAALASLEGRFPFGVAFIVPPCSRMVSTINSR